jgi:ABC-type amino acid transport substrate-binding protein
MVRDGRADAFIFYETTFSIFMKKININPDLFEKVFKIEELSGTGLYLATNKESDP